MKEQRIQSLEAFYPYYLNEHRNKTCRVLHVIGTTLVIALALTALISLNPYWLYYIPIAGYGFAWVGHFFFEKNKPATFKYPLWSLISDFKMYFDILRGKINLDASKDNL